MNSPRTIRRQERVNDRGKFVVVWKKQTDGAWMIVADIWNSDLPAATAAKA
jgi:ketosteroid isomerase-like protein